MTQDDHPMHRAWNYHPALALADTSIFTWPPDPRFLASWFAQNWLTLSERVITVALSLTLCAAAYPSLAKTRTLAAGWIAQVWAVSMGLMIVVAGGLHWYF